MAHGLIAGGPESARAADRSPTERLRRGPAAPPWQERGTSTGSRLAPAPRRRSPRGRTDGRRRRGAHTAPRVYAGPRTADTVSGASAAPGCWDGVTAGTGRRPPPVTARTQLAQPPQHPRHVVSTRRRHL
ncbi:hypothetical protein EZV63_11840 [Streptomyces sp. VN1]|nr:hypothetical protein EZV63_11840 [Streptomyces sp. VN1]